MLSWLLDGSALLVGSALFDPSSGVWTRLPVPESAALAVGTEGRVAALERAGGRPRVSLLRGGAVSWSVELAGELPEGLAFAHALVGEEVYVHATDPQSGELRCWWVEAAGQRTPERCLEGGFAQIDRILPAGTGRWVVDSHGEGHPDVSLVRWSGGESAPVALPWEDLYPFGPLELLPRADGRFDILTRCPLGPPRPCVLDEGADAADEPARWYDWAPEQASYLKAQGRDAEVLPDPSSQRVATLRGDRLCLRAPDGDRTCTRVPRGSADPTR